MPDDRSMVKLYEYVKIQLAMVTLTGLFQDFVRAICIKGDLERVLHMCEVVSCPFCRGGFRVRQATYAKNRD